MKKMIKALCAVLMCFVFIFAAVMPAAAMDDVPDLSDGAGITVHYMHNDKPVSGTAASLYCVALGNSDGGFTPIGKFADYSVEINKMLTVEQWDAVAETFRYYIAADGITPMATGVSGDEGTVLFDITEAGIYLVLTAQVKDGDTVVCYKPALVSVPTPTADGHWLTMVDVYPKVSEYTPTMGELSLRAEKQWANDSSAVRPQSINISVVHDGVVVYREVLSDANGWSFVWSAKDDGSEWGIVEEAVPSGYTNAVERKGDTFIITNTYKDGNVQRPPTGDDSNLTMWAVIMSMAGLGLILIAICQGRRRDA